MKITTVTEFVDKFIELDKTYGLSLKDSYSIKNITRNEVNDALKNDREYLNNHLLDIQHYIRTHYDDTDPDLGYDSCLIDRLIEFLN